MHYSILSIIIISLVALLYALSINHRPQLLHNMHNRLECVYLCVAKCYRIIHTHSLSTRRGRRNAMSTKSKVCNKHVKSSKQKNTNYK